jgi:ribonuclease HII
VYLTTVHSQEPGSLRELEDHLRRCGCRRIAGVDEVGRGPLAGPVVAAAVVLKAGADLPEVTDSKLLADEVRRRLVPEIIRQSEAVGVGMVWEREIDRINILQATFAAMRQALSRVGADGVIVDGTQKIPGIDLPQLAQPKADRTSLSVAAASIVAKVIRDDLMIHYDGRYPVYGFAQHKGYATPEHFAALDLHGPSELHRQSFLVRWRERKTQAALTLDT